MFSVKRNGGFGTQLDNRVSVGTWVICYSGNIYQNFATFGWHRKLHKEFYSNRIIIYIVAAQRSVYVSFTEHATCTCDQLDMTAVNNILVLLASLCTQNRV